MRKNMKRINVIFGFVLLILGFGGITGRAQNTPPTPFVDKGACPFECCTYREWSVLKPTSVRRAMSNSSATLFRVRKGEKVQGVTGVVITTRPGVVRVLKTAKIGEVTVHRGETIYLLTYLGEGFFRIWRKGKLLEGEAFEDTTAFRVVNKPVAVWWVKIKNRRGQIGWSREPDNFGNKDQCGN
jgi:hypothetical protein